MIIENRLAFDPRLVNYEDLDFTVQVLQYTHSAVLLPEPYYQYICQYEQDHTVDRIAKLPDVIDNTDLIAETFFRYMAACPDCHRPQAAAICQVVLHIYIELLGYKIQRIPYREISGYLEDFCRDTYVQQCLKMVGEPVIRENRRLRWILERKALPIWLEKQYWRTRHAVARTGKLLLYQAGMRKSL